MNGPEKYRRLKRIRSISNCPPTDSGDRPERRLTNLVNGNAPASVRGIRTSNEYDMGEAAFAIGIATEASGAASYAEGRETVASGGNTHAEGFQSAASGLRAHAEGEKATASGEDAHAEGRFTNATALASHAEGTGTVASEFAAHAEGGSSQASGVFSHAEGTNTRATAGSSHSEGLSTAASAISAHAEGFSTAASASSSHAEGTRAKASGENAHAEGFESIASGNHSHAEGYQSQAVGFSTHAEGYACAATGFSAHAEGGDTVAGYDYAHAEGGATQAPGAASHSEGIFTTASGWFSHSEGVYTSTNLMDGSHIMGRYGAADTPYSWFLANGTNESNPGLSAKILFDGNAYIDVAWNGGGADYAELYESESGQPIEPGYFVTTGESGIKIRIAKADDRYILGIVSASPGFVAGAGELRWKSKFKTDKWGKILYADVAVPEIKDKSGRVLSPSRTESRPVINPDYDPNRKYVPRLQRPEWVKVALLGMVPVRHDGSLTPGGFCRPSFGGIATAAQDGYKVLKRVDDSQALIVFR